MTSEPATRPAPQQPLWSDEARVEDIRAELAASAPLVGAASVRRLRGVLARVARGEACVVQCGDCAEDPAESGAVDVARKAAMLDLLAGAMRLRDRRPVVRVGRIAGQFAKPRSRPVEVVGGTELAVFRGHMVNCPEPDPQGRRPDPERMLSGYRAATTIMGHLGWRPDAALPGMQPPVWTSHEALLLDYEIPMVRREPGGEPVLASTHWPWIGYRTGAPDGAHVALLARVTNPVAYKVGPDLTTGTLLEVCERLDPRREPGRLTLIARMGADLVAERLPDLVQAARRAGHPVSWLTDPMHGNTVVAPDGLKTRFVETIAREVRLFLGAVRRGGGVPGGIHLETTPDTVTECVQDASQIDRVGEKYTSLCDPRLNPEQAASVVMAWHE
ncbi:3-deoxy-7-phosphoheptulonate synthase [Rhizomonospora bruguierae]|uniref:3-deoxy-7-phosphoheptulonate synthase n=1 Tax=Rhizomonospora bruguierae TaxID=1581705 RepID=UPI001BD07682|nr:3-deoxy-7-phosphoheptulonate synthase [Micromonospora sp. NBRC 107566]